MQLCCSADDSPSPGLQDWLVPRLEALDYQDWDYLDQRRAGTPVRTGTGLGLPGHWTGLDWHLPVRTTPVVLCEFAQNPTIFDQENGFRHQFTLQVQHFFDQKVISASVVQQKNPWAILGSPGLAV